MSLWLCLRFNQLPVQCLSRCEQQPVAVVAAQRVIGANDCAIALGVRTGMGSATVRALAGAEPVRLLEQNTQAEQRCLQQLCCWAYTITPTLSIWQTDCLQLEISGCLNLFRGLDALLLAVDNGISRRGYAVRQGLAATPKAAWLLSFASQNIAMAIEQPLQERLAPLPLHLLQAFSATVDALHRAGLQTLGDVLALPSAAIARRCNQAFTHFLQQLLGQSEDLQVNFQPPATFSDAYWFGYEVKTNSELLPAAQQLLQSLCHFLRNTQLQTSEIHWQLIGMEQQLQNVCVRSTSSHSNWQSWYRLSCMRFEQLQLSRSVEGLNLSCQQLSPAQQESLDLFQPHNQHEPLAALLDRLRNRLGLHAVEKIGCRDEHLPEFATLTGSHCSAEGEHGHHHCTQRPFWLLPQPQILHLRGQHLYWNSSLRLLYGPERIEDNWWQDAVSRDYYIASDSTGQHCWVFHDRLARQWYIHGVFA